METVQDSVGWAGGGVAARPRPAPDLETEGAESNLT